ncbi:MAG: hypothetical protein OSB03_04920 [Vicinamibacterales bacterium]|nr:hypothetical protein [Vicinamibacterales bacterium]
MKGDRAGESPSVAPARQSRASGRWTGAALLAAAVITLATETYLVAVRTAGVPRVTRTDQSFLVDGLGQGRRVSQTFWMRAGGLDGVRLSAVAQGEAGAGNFAMALYEVSRDRDGALVDGAERLLFRDRVTAGALTRHPTFLFAVPRVDDSAGRSYRVDIWMPEPRPDAGIGLWAIDGRASEGGSLFINGQSAYAERVVEARATRTTGWARLRYRFGGAGLTLLLILAAVAHAALFVGLRAVVAGAHGLTVPPK